jgi:hypothetical protein
MRSMLSRATSMQEGEDDEDINTSATIIPSVEILGPITSTTIKSSGKLVLMLLSL